MRLQIMPTTFRAACAFIAEYHRHHRPPRGHKFSLQVVDENMQVRGVIVVGRPVARAYDNGLTAEVTRSCTDGCKNANSCLYAAAWRVSREMGYQRLISYTHADESGISLKAAGWKIIAERKSRGSWAESSVKLRHIRDDVGSGGVQRVLWEVSA